LREPPGSFLSNHNVLSLNPTFVASEASDPSDLLNRAQAGDSDAFGELCRVHETRLLRQAMTLCRNTALAEDLAQDSLVEAWKSLRRYNGRCQFFTWLCAILLNRFRNTIRQKRLVPLSSLVGDDQDEFRDRLNHLTAHDSLPDEAAEFREKAELVLACIQALPPKHQQVIYLRFYVDDSLEGIAEALGCSVGTVKSRLFRALDKLRAMRALIPQSVDSKIVAAEVTRRILLL
jgi:RNA polymerase sigma-70 factor (ECF subfamily)